jgi:lysozyme
MPQAAIDLAKRFEGFERKVKRGIEITAVPYICPAGFWTIGYGHLCDPKHPPITEAEAEVYLARDLQSALAATLRYCPVLATEPEGGSPPSWTSRSTLALGGCRLGSTLRRWVGASISGTGLTRHRRATSGSCDTITSFVNPWVYGKTKYSGGKVLPGGI